MWNIFNHLNMIRKRPGMYIWSGRITDLDTYLSWYAGCLFEKWITEIEIDQFHQFHEWIAKYYDYSESTSGWTNMIKNKTKTEEEALQLFFELLEKFKAEKGFK